MNFFSETQCAEFDNGFRLYHLHRPGPAVELQFFVGTGSIHEDKYLGCGLSHFLEHMLFQGCKGFPGHAVTDTVTALGGELNAYTGYDRTCYRMQMPQEHWQKAVEMLAAQVRFPELPEERFILEKDVILRECERGMDNVVRRIFEKFMRLAYLQHPLRHPVIGYRELIAGVTRQIAMEYHALRYTPERSFAVVVGECPFNALSDAIAENIANWQRSNMFEPSMPVEPLTLTGRKTRLEFNDPLSRQLSGFRAPEFGDPELPALEVLMGMFSGSESSLLNTELVLNSCLAVNADGFCSTVGRESVCGIIAEAVPGKFSRMESMLKKLIDRFGAGGFTKAMMEREKQQQYADRLRGFRDIVNLAGEIGGSVLYTGTPDAGDVYLEALRKVNMDELRAAAEKYFVPERMFQVNQHRQAAGSGKRSVDSRNQVQCEKLRSGAGFIHLQDKRLPLVSFAMILPGGGIYEQPGQRGISRVLADMFACGTEKYGSAGAVWKKLDALGADLSVSAGANSIVADFTVPKDKLLKTAELAGEIFGRPLFLEHDFERERQRIIEELRVRAENPVKSAVDHAAGALFGDHPCGNGGRGYIRDVRELSLTDVQKFYESLFFAPRAALGFCGDCSSAEAAKAAELISGQINWSSSGHEKAAAPQVNTAPERCVYELEREQTAVLCCLPGPAIKKSDTLVPFEILLQSENSLGSYLFKQVREKHALCYAVGMNFFSGFYPGMISFYSMTSRESGEHVLEQLRKEIARIGSGAIGKEEFEAAKKGACFDCAKMLDSPDALLRNMLFDSYYGLDPAGTMHREKLFAGLSKDEFDRSVRDFLDVSKVAEVLAIGNGKK